MNRVKELLFRFLCGLLLLCPLNLVQAITEQDLIASYQQEKESITQWLSLIKDVPDAIKTLWINALNKASSSIDSIYTLARRSIQPLTPQLNSSNDIDKLNAAEQISSISDTAIKQIENISDSLQLTIGEGLTNYENSAEGKKQQEDLKKALEEQKKLHEAQDEYQKKIAQEIAAVSKINGLLNSIENDLHLYALNSYQKPYDSSKIVPLVKELQSVIGQSYSYYSSLGPINVNDQNSFFISSIKRLITFLLDQVFIQKRSLQDKKIDGDYYKGVYSISRMLLGTQNAQDNFVARDGFDALINNEIKKYLTNPISQATLYNYYLNSKNNITYIFFRNTLLSFINSLSDPTDEQRIYATGIYQALMSELAAVDQKNKTVIEDSQALNNSMGILYVTSAQALLNKLQIQKDSLSIVTKIIEFYNQAAAYFQKANSGQAQTYATFAKNLSDGIATLNKAQATKLTDIETAVSLYKQAQNFFKMGSDLIDVSKISITLVDLEGRYALLGVKKLFSQFEGDNKTLIQNYLDYCNTIQSSLKLDQLKPLFNNLIDLYTKVLSLYSEAADAYNTAIENNLPLNQTPDTQKLNLNFKNIQDVLTALQQAYDLLQNGDRLLPLQTLSDLHDAEISYYQNALSLFKKADLLYSKNPEMTIFIPYYFLIKNNTNDLDYETLSQRHIAQFSIEIANQISQADIALAYYNNANTRKNYLSKEIQDFLTAKINQLVQSKDAVEKLFAQAQDTEKKLLALKIDDWAAKDGSGLYSSSASDQWDQLLQQYISLYHLGKAEAKAAFLNALQEYADNFEKYGPQNSQIMLALIYYQQYILHLNDKEAQSAAASLQEIETLLNNAAQYVQKLLDSTNAESLKSTATNDQEKIIIWVDQAEYAFNKQKDIIASIGISLSNEQQIANKFLEKQINADKTIYNFVLVKKSIEISDPSVAMADLFKKIGDLNFQKKDYIPAYSAYTKARQWYSDAGKIISDEFNKRIALSYTLYVATYYRNLVIPDGQNSLATLQVPDSYELQVFEQTVPSDLSDQFPNVDFLTKDEQKRTTFLIDLATSMYLFNKINEFFGSETTLEGYSKSWITFAPLLKLSFSDLQQNSVYTALPSDNKVAFVNMVGFAAKLKAELTSRVAKKQTNFVLQQASNKKFNLYTYSIPLPRFPDTQNYYKGYPSVISYYSAAAMLFKPGPSSEMISIGQTSLPHGNDQDAYQATIMDQVKTFLSEGYSYQQQLFATQKTKPWKDLLNTNKNDMSQTVDTYQDLQTAVNNDFNQMTLYYNGPQSSNLIDQKSALAGSIHDLIGKSYKNWADMLIPFLIGDPLAADYVSVLKDILQKYVVAITTYGFDTSLYQEMSKKYNDAGQLLVNQGKYFDSISYFYTAASTNKKITPQTPEILKTIDQFYISYFDALVRGSTLKMGQFHKAVTEPITIGQEKISFNDLLLKYLKDEVTPEEASTMDDIKNLVLDALIFYNICNAYITQGIESIDEPSILKWIGIDDQTAAKVNQTALGLITSFTEKNGIALDYVDSVTLMMNRTDFSDGKDFVEMLLNGFNQFEAKIKNSQDAFNRAVGYSALAQLAVKLYEAFGNVFIITYYGTLTTDSYTSLSAAIQARTNEILSPSKLYIG